MEYHTFIKPPPDHTEKHPALQVQSDMEIVLIGRFFMTWRDTKTDHQQCLGDLSIDSDPTRACFLLFGANVNSRELLLYLHLPLKLSASSKGNRNFYLVIPVECFDPDDGAAYTDVVSFTHKTHETPNLNKAGVEVGAKLLHTRFILKKQGYVVMSKAKAPKNLKEQSRGLLLSLKSLAGARGFDLYVRDLEPNERVMRNFLRKLCEGTFRTPEIDHALTFNSRPHDRDCWGVYGCGDEALPAVWNPLLEEFPPRYEEAVQLSSSKSNDAPTQSTPDNSGEGHCSPQEAARVPSEEPDHEGPECPQEATRLEHNPLERDEQRESSQETIRQEDLQQDDGEGLAVAESGYTVQVGPHQDYVRKRNAGEALLDTVSDAHDSTSAAMWSVAAGGKRQKSRSFHVHDENEPDPAEMESGAVRIFGGFGASFSPSSVFANGPNRIEFDDAQYRWFHDAALWLSVAWVRNHSIHDVYFKELASLCDSIRVRNRTRFERIRIRCMALCSQRARASQDEGPFGCALTERSRWMVDFVYHRLGAGYDVLIMDELIAMDEAARLWMQVGGDEGPTGPDRQEYERRQAGFYLQMAACLLVAFYKRKYNCNDGCREGHDEVQVLA